MEGRNNYKKIFIVFAFVVMLGFSAGTVEASTTIKNLNKSVSNLGLLAWWNFDGAGVDITNSTNNGTAVDSSGSGHTLTLNGADWHEETSRVLGKTGQSLYFNGGNSTDGGNFADNLTDMSISAWVKTTVTGTTAPIVAKWDEAGNLAGWQLYLDSSGYPSFYEQTTSNTARIGCSVSSPLADGTWHHIVVVNASIFYIDGVAQFGSCFVSGSVSSTSSSTSVTVGNTTSNNFEGDIDEVRIYNRQLSEAEAIGIYKMGTSKGNITPKQTISNSGLVGYWPFDGKDTIWSSSTAGTTADLSGTGNTGTLTNMLQSTTQVLGKFGQALNFDGSDDGVSIGSASNITSVTTGDFTFTAWIKPRSFGGNSKGRIITTDNGSGGGCIWFVDNANVVQGMSLNCNSSAFAVVSNTNIVLPNNQWQQVVVRVASNVYTFFVQGISGGSGSYGSPRNASTGSPGTIGRDPVTAVREFDGIIDEVRMYNRALSDAEITALYNLGAGTKSNVTKSKLIPNGLVGYWPFDGKYMDWSGPTATDVTGNGHTGTPTNMSQMTASAIGKVGQGLLFDGSNDSVDIADSSVFDLSSSSKYTWSFWIKPVVFGNLKDSFATYDGGGVNFLSVSTHTTSDTNYGPCTACVSVAWANTGGSNYLIAHTTDSALATNKWSHILITYDGSLSQSSRFVIYVDGVDVTNNGDIYSTGTISTISPATTQIGGEPSAHANAVLDEFRFYNRKLSASEIAQLARP